MGINLLLDISRQAFSALDASMNVASQNVANAETEGYHRRQVNLQSVDHQPTGILGSGSIAPVGGGVSVASYTRMRDSLIDQTRWESRGTLGFAQEQQRVLGTIEALFPSGVGSLQDALDGFFNAWTDLSNHPTDSGVRLALRGSAESLISKLNDLDSGLQSGADQAAARLSSDVAQANSILERVAELNAEIAHANRGGSPNFGAEDERSMLATELSEMLSATFKDQSDGSMSVYVDGMQLVQQAEVMPLTLDTSGATPSLTFGDTGIALATGTDSGRIGALMSSITTQVGAVLSDLDQLTATLVSQVNAIHSTAYGSDGATGRDFFDATGTAAGSIALSADVAASIDAIAAGYDATATGDNTAAMDINDLRNAKVLASGTRTIGDYAVDIATSIGSSVHSANQRASASASSVANLDAMAKGVSGVSIEEEMTNLIRLQQAYGAAARVLQTAQDMFDSLMRI